MRLGGGTRSSSAEFRDEKKRCSATPAIDYKVEATNVEDLFNGEAEDYPCAL